MGRATSGGQVDGEVVLVQYSNAKKTILMHISSSNRQSRT
jgi:hypothetical protein